MDGRCATETMVILAVYFFAVNFWLLTVPSPFLLYIVSKNVFYNLYIHSSVKKGLIRPIQPLTCTRLRTFLGHRLRAARERAFAAKLLASRIRVGSPGLRPPRQLALDPQLRAIWECAVFL